MLFTVLSVVGIIGFIWPRADGPPSPSWTCACSPRAATWRWARSSRSCSGFGLFASVFVFPIFTQRILGFTADQTGLIATAGRPDGRAS
ncbi:MAG: hypothetical protein WKG07_23635 [Hymenobacter sp.]